MIKRILVTGQNSYLGNHLFDRFINQEDYRVDKLSLKNINVEQLDLSQYQIIFHVAGIAHTKLNKKNREKFNTINYELTKKLANKAKSQGVNQFIFISSMLVYSSKENKIDTSKVPNPDSLYGKSKLKAEFFLKDIETEDFKVAILRPSMIYGFNSKGNFQRLIKFTQISFVFPHYKNQRSFLYVDHFINAVENIIKQEYSGIFHLANSKPESTTKLVEGISNSLNKKILFIRFLNPLLSIGIKISKTINKIFGTFYYDASLITHSFTYNSMPFEKTIQESLSTGENS